MSQPSNRDVIQRAADDEFPREGGNEEKKFGSHYLRLEEKHLEKLRKLEANEFKEEIGARKKVRHQLFWLTCLWLFAVFCIILLNGFGGIRTGQEVREIHFHLSDAVLVALISGTTATVIGLFLVVVRYLFPRRDHR